VVCAPIRYVYASTNVGPPPDRARSVAARVTARVASTSLPSTLTPGIPNPEDRLNSGTRVWRVLGSEIAHWLFWQKKTTGAL